MSCKAEGTACANTQKQKETWHLKKMASHLVKLESQGQGDLNAQVKSRCGYKCGQGLFPS